LNLSAKKFSPGPTLSITEKYIHIVDPLTLKCSILTLKKEVSVNTKKLREEAIHPRACPWYSALRVNKSN